MERATEQLVSYATDLTFEELTDDAFRPLKRRVVDSLACALAALPTTPVSAARALARTAVGVPPAHVLLTGEATTPERAAYVGALMVRYWDFNDVYLHGGHPSNTIPCVLAVADALGTSGRDTVVAMVVAYEAFCALTDAQGPVGTTPPARVALASALGVGRLMGMDAAQLSDAISLATASNITPTIPRDRPLTMWRAVWAAGGAHNGVLAAQLAQVGITGPPEPFRALGAEPGDELPPLGGRGREFRIERSHLKTFTSEYHAQAAISAAMDLREQCAIDEIDEVTAYVYAHAMGGIGTGEAKWRVTDVDTALHSLPYLLCVALLDGDVTPAQFTSERMASADVHGLIDRILVREDPALTAPYPGIVGARLEARTKSGQTLSVECYQPKGHFENQMTDGEVEAKFRTYAAGLLAPDAQERALSLVWHLEDQPDVRGLLEALLVQIEPLK